MRLELFRKGFVHSILSTFVLLFIHLFIYYLLRFTSSWQGHRNTAWRHYEGLYQSIASWEVDPYSGDYFPAVNNKKRITVRYINMSRNVISDNKKVLTIVYMVWKLMNIYSKKRVESMLLSTFFEEADSFINLYQIISKVKSSGNERMNWYQLFPKKDRFLCKSFMHYIFFSPRKIFPHFNHVKLLLSYT